MKFEIDLNDKIALQRAETELVAALDTVRYLRPPSGGLNAFKGYIFFS